MKPILKAKNMITIRRLGVYLISWLLLIFVTALISSEGLFIKIDELIYEKYYATNELKNDTLYTNKIVLVDVPNRYKNTSLSLAQKRKQTALLLSRIDSMVISNEDKEDYKKPTIILDMWYGSSSDGLVELKESLSILKENKIKVYALYKSPKMGSNVLYDTHESGLRSELYEKYFEGKRLHVNYNKNENKCLRTYNSFIEIKRDTILGYSEKIESLINRVANDQLGIEQTDFNNLERESVNTNNLIKRFKPRTFQFTDTLEILKRDYKEFNKTLNLNGSFIIIGMEDGDQIEICDNHYVFGAYLLASGLVNKLSINKSFKAAIDDVPFQLSMAFLFALLVCAIFALLYKYIRSLQTKPVLIGFLAFVIGVLFLMVTGFAFLRTGSIIRPALPGVSMFWASILAMHFANKFLVSGIIEGSGKYDVFISYSFGDKLWVKQYLKNPLSELKKSDGSKLEIFFAEQSIEIGELFVSKYMKAIVNSKLFIPVMSREYYNKNHCKNEMDLAVKRKIEELINICILAFDYKYVPPEFTNMLFIDINKQNDFMTPIENEILKLDIKHNDEPDKEKKIDLNKKIDVDIQEEVELKKTKQQNEPSIIAKGDALNLDHEAKIEDSEKEQVETIETDTESKEEELMKDKKNKKDKKDKGKKSKKEKKDKVKSTKKDKKRTAKKQKKKSKKEDKKKAIKKSDKKSKKEETKKSKKHYDKKNKKEQMKKAKKELIKKDKKLSGKKGKKNKKKAKKALEKKVMKQVLKKIKKQLDKKSKKKKKK